jgi:hypothetical protein
MEQVTSSWSIFIQLTNNTFKEALDRDQSAND